MRAAVLLLLLRAAGAIKLYLAPSCNKFPHPHPCGADSHAGLTPDAPLETVQRARDLLRASSDAEKRVELAGGVYELNATLELTAADSGTVWAAAAGGGNVTLSGGEPADVSVTIPPVRLKHFLFHSKQDQSISKRTFFC
eukprot:COSAG04_NODE_1915_length_5234_cov_2.563778_2_plen_139_part_01